MGSSVDDFVGSWKGPGDSVRLLDEMQRRKLEQFLESERPSADAFLNGPAHWRLDENVTLDESQRDYHAATLS